MTVFDSIQELIIKYTASDITLAAFRDQFVPLYLAIKRQTDLEAVNLADRVESLYADLLAGELNDKQFALKLTLFYPMIVIVSDPESSFGSGTGSNFESITGNRRSVSNDTSAVDPQAAEYA